MTLDTDATELWSISLNAFRDALARRPMPGCGAAAAVSAGFGLSLLLKGLHLGEAHRQNAERNALIHRGDAIMRALSPLANEDVAAFDAMMAALHAPETTDAQSAERSKAIARAASRAVAVPLDTARRCLEALTLAEEARTQLEAQFESDATAGAHLLVVAVQSVLLNVDANLDALGSDEERQQVRKERDTLKIELAAVRKSLGLVE